MKKLIGALALLLIVHMVTCGERPPLLPAITEALQWGTIGACGTGVTACCCHGQKMGCLFCSCGVFLWWFHYYAWRKLTR